MADIWACTMENFHNRQLTNKQKKGTRTMQGRRDIRWTYMYAQYETIRRVQGEEEEIIHKQKPSVAIRESRTSTTGAHTLDIGNQIISTVEYFGCSQFLQRQNQMGSNRTQNKQDQGLMRSMRNLAIGRNNTTRLSISSGAATGTTSSRASSAGRTTSGR